MKKNFRCGVLGSVSLLLLLPGVAGADPRFGAMTHFAQGWDTSLIPLVKAGGMTQVRDELYWEEVERTKGVYRFPATFDGYMLKLAQNGVSPLIVLNFENPLYDAGNTPYTTEACNAYARYAVEVLRHYGSQVKTVEIWNEYNGGFCRGPATQDRTGTYLKMLKAAYAAIKKERPDVVVLAGGTAGVPLPYWEKLLAGGVLSHADGLSVHPYRYTFAPEGIENDITDFRRLVASYGTPKPVWVSEIGWELKPAMGAGDFEIDENTQARFLIRCYALLLSAGVEHIYWYSFRDHQDFTMGLMHEDATAKPAYQACARLISHLDGAKFVRRETAADGFYSLLFRTTAGVEKRVLWSQGPQTFTLTGATQAVDRTGRALSVTAPVTISWEPVLVAGPLRSLPSAAGTRPIVADSIRDFSLKTNSPWSYGSYLPATNVFLSLPTYLLTDWRAEWTGPQPYISITAIDQHPSFSGLLPVSVVRRWRSDRTQKVRVTGSFRCGTDGGDGVGVSVAVNGVPSFRRLLAKGATVVTTFDFVVNAVAGTTVDFAVDPGPEADVGYDATAVAVTIRAEP